MKRFALIAFAAITVAGCDQDALSPDGFGGPRFSTTGGTLPITVVGSDAVAYGINDVGQVVGYTWGTADGSYQAVLWQNGGMVKLGTLGGESEARAINGAGQVVGSSYTASGEEHAFLWQNGTMIDLGTLGGNESRATAINDKGQVVGFSKTASGDRHAFLWQNGTMIDLGTIGGGYSAATGINEAGQVVGYHDSGAFLWQNGTMTDLGDFRAHAINEAGQVVGSSGGHAVLWQNGTIVDLATIDGHSEATAINDVGQVVGQLYKRQDGGPHTLGAFMWQNGTMTELASSGESSGAFGINKAGQVVGFSGDNAVLWGSVSSDPGTTPTGSGVSVTPNDATTGSPAPVGLTFSSVSGSGTTTVASGTLSQANAPVPQGFRVDGSSTYYEIKTSATFTDLVTVCITYTEASYGTETQLKLLHYKSTTGQWEDITTSVDGATNTVCGRTSSFSPFLVAEKNAAPTITALRLPGSPAAVGTPVQVSALFRDANLRDRHTAQLSWGDGQQTAGSVSQAQGSGTVTGTHSYLQAGLYTLTLHVRDGLATGSRTSVQDAPAYVVVYDPGAGFVTGGGWILPPAGAYAADPSLSGKAHFSLTLRYAKGASTPSGNLEFKVGRVKFRSSASEWLVLSGSRVHARGSGTINGAGRYGFLLTAEGGQGKGGGKADKLRIKIWDQATGRVVYDTQRGAAEDASATTALGGGNITLHKP